MHERLLARLFYALLENVAYVFRTDVHAHYAFILARNDFIGISLLYVLFEHCVRYVLRCRTGRLHIASGEKQIAQSQGYHNVDPRQIEARHLILVAAISVIKIAVVRLRLVCHNYPFPDSLNLNDKP